MKYLSKKYNSIFAWLTKNKIYKYREEEDEVHRALVAVLLTSILMWSYTLNAIFCIDSQALMVIGIAASLIHLLSPLVYKFTQSVSLTVNIFIGSGYFFQIAHACYTGGFYSNTIIWLSVLPLIAGLVRGAKMLLSWSIFSIISVVILFFLQDYTYNLISDTGRIWAQFNIAIGYVILNLVLMKLYIYFKEEQAKKSQSRTESIRRLLRIVSHDIANPLTVILHSSNIVNKTISLNKDNYNEKVEKIEKYNQKILKSSFMIKEILENCKSFEAIDSGKLEITLVPVLLNDIIENSLFIFKDKIEKKQINFKYDFKKFKHIKVIASEVAIKNQIFNNLFSNSIKFMDIKGTIQITAQATSDYILVDFSDTGIGMGPNLLLNIFRSDVATTHKGIDGESGTGFGMPIVKETLKQFGATIKVSSVEKREGVLNHGTTFTMKFLKKID